MPQQMPERRIMRYLIALALALTAFGGAASAAPAVIQLPLYKSGGGVSHPMTLPDGTVLNNTQFFLSKASGVSVGRTYLNGPHLQEKTDYTDVFMIVHGSGDGTFNGKKERFRLGDVVIMPKGTVFESRNLRHYIHFFASFDREKDAAFNGPIAIQRLRPGDLSSSAFETKDGIGRHAYYAGRTVRVEAERFRHFKDAHSRMATDSRLLFVTDGAGAIQDGSGSVINLKPREAVLIPKGATLRLIAKKLTVVAVIFDQDANQTAE